MICHINCDYCESLYTVIMCQCGFIKGIKARSWALLLPSGICSYMCTLMCKINNDLRKEVIQVSRNTNKNIERWRKKAFENEMML